MFDTMPLFSFRGSYRFTLISVLSTIAMGIAVGAELRVRQEGGIPTLQVRGDKDDEWRFEASSNLGEWSSATGMGTMYSDSEPRVVPISHLTDPVRFYRAVKTDGLFDDRVIRTLHLKFEMANWATLLTRGRMTGSNTLAVLSLDNGKTNFGVGARYKGNTSFDMGGAKKSINLEMDYTNSSARLMGYRTVNLNNAAGDETLMRESVYFNIMHEYAPSPRGALARLWINGTNWGVYSFVEQENSVLVNEWFASDKGDRWRAPNIGGAGPGTGGGFGGSGSALSWLGTNVSAYRSNYELKTDNSTNAWQRLVSVIDVLNNTPTNQVDVLADRLESVLAVDRWLWFLAVENLFADDDSYFNKGADYGFYYEVESGRIHPIEHDGNEAFTPGDINLSPVQGINITARPVLHRLLRVPKFKQRYLAHMRTVMEERYNPPYLTALIQRVHRLSVADVIADPKKNFNMQAYTNDLNALRGFVTNRYRALTNHAELRPMPPRIEAVSVPVPAPDASSRGIITARVSETGGEGIASVWLYWREKAYGAFQFAQMWDHGLHGDGEAKDGVYGAAIPASPAGTRIRYYVEARSANAAGAASFYPARAEQVTLSYRVRTGDVADSPVIINELMADNTRTIADPQGEFDDWIELKNTSDRPVNLAGYFLSDEANNPRKWQFPPDSVVPANGFLIVWADEDLQAGSGLHTNFKLSNNGETLLLVGPDDLRNGLLDAVTFGDQDPDRSYGRTTSDPKLWGPLVPSPGRDNP